MKILPALWCYRIRLCVVGVSIKTFSGCRVGNPVRADNKLKENSYEKYQ